MTATKNRVTPGDRPASSLRNALLLISGLIGLIVLVRLIFVRAYDYDEISHAHMAWLVSIGEKPYQDFAANHFPFFWIIMSPLMRVLPQSPSALIILRGLAMMLNAVFIGSLGSLICLVLRPWQRVWAAACFGLIVFSPTAVHFLMEFRPDALSNALLFSALLWLRLRGSERPADGLLAGFFIGVAVMVNTKYILLPFVMGAVVLAIDWRQIKSLWPFALAIAGGFVAALAAGVMLLLSMHISIPGAWRLVVTYNGTVERSQSFGFGLVGSLVHNPLLYVLILPGLVACTAMLIRRNWRPKPFEIAIFVFLVLNLCTTTRPWKQYSASWLLLAAGLPARSLPLLVERLGLRMQTAIAACVVGVSVLSFLVASRGALPTVSRNDQDRAMEYVLQHVPPDGYVLSSYYIHPIFRRDSLFKTVYDAEVAGTDGLEQFMPDLAPGAYGEEFQQSGYEKDLDTRQPAIILMQAGYTLSEIRAMTDHMKEHPGAYGEFQIPGTALTVLQENTAGPAGGNTN